MNHYIRSIIIILLFASCEKEIKVNIPEHKPKITVYSYTEVGGIITATIGHSIGVLNYNGSQDLYINNARGAIYVNGVLYDTLTLNAFTGQYISNTQVESGKTYKIVIVAPGYDTAEATSTVPSTVLIQEPIQHKPFARRDKDNGDQDELTLKFNEPSTTGDYYLVHFLNASETDSTGRYPSYAGCVFTTDANVETASDNEGEIGFNTCIDSKGIFIKDATFNGKTKELSLFVSFYDMRHESTFGGDSLYPAIKLYHIPEAYFRYLKSHQASDNAEGNPFAEPVNVYSNIKNGYGIFTVVSRDYKKIKN